MKVQPDLKTPFILSYPSVFSTRVLLSRSVVIPPLFAGYSHVEGGAIAVSLRIPLLRLCKEKRPRLRRLPYRYSRA